MATVTSATKHFPTAKEGFTTTTSGSIAPGATSVGLTSVSGLTNGAFMVLVVDPTDTTKKQAFAGTVDTGGSQLTNVIWTEGTNTTHSAGATVVDYETATHWALYNKGLLVEHNQDGTHGAITGTSLAVSGSISATGAATVGGNLSVTGYAQDKGQNLYTIRDEQLGDFVVSGGVWTGDAYASTLAASMTALVCYINGQRGTISAVTARAFIASKDTYIDVLNSSGTFSLVYTEVSNNAASPALASNSIRLGVIVTAANIAAATSINQGQPERTVPTTCNPGKSGTDSLGNILRNTNSLGDLAPLDYIATYTLGGNSTSYTDHATVTFTLLKECRVKISANVFGQWAGTPAVIANARIMVDGSQSVYARNDIYTNGDAWSIDLLGRITLAAGSHTIKTQSSHSQGTSSFVGSSIDIEAKPVA